MIKKRSFLLGLPFGAFIATFLLVSAANNSSLPWSGLVVEPQTPATLSYNLPAVDFGVVAVGEDVVIQYEVTSDIDVTLNVSAPQGGGVGEVSVVVDPSTLNLVAGVPQTVDVTYTGVFSGDVSGTFEHNE